MARRFNPPPGWPTPPSGWAPPGDWTPDPRWPRPPAGWRLWLEDDLDQDPRDAGQSVSVTWIDAPSTLGTRRLSKWVWAAVALVFLLGLGIGGPASALVSGGVATFAVGLLAGLRGVGMPNGGRQRSTAVVTAAVGLIAAFGGALALPRQVTMVADRPPAATPAPATTSAVSPPTSAARPSPSPKSTVDGKARAKAKAEAEAEAKRRATAKAKTKGSSVAFRHFKVSVTQINRDASQVRLQAKVCVRSLPPDPQGNRTRISWDPWSVRAGSRSIEPDLRASPLKDEFPADATYRVGQCAAGWIPFATSSAVTQIVYANGVGDRAVWDADNLAAPPTIRADE